MSSKYGIETRFTDENVTTTCPACGQRSTYNRVSDLKTTRLISCGHIKCPEAACQAEIVINGDIVCPRHELLLYEAYGHRRQKHLRECITTLATAYELLLKRIIHHTITSGLIRDSEEPDWEELNAIHRSIEMRIERWGFLRCRSAVVTVLTARPPRNTLEARRLIGEISRASRSAPDLPDLENPELAMLLGCLCAATVPDLRNRVVHGAYRPTDGEAAAALDEARTIILGFSEELDLRSSEPSRI